MSARPLGIIPTYIRSEEDYALAETTIKTFIASAGYLADLMVVDDCSPREDLVLDLAQRCSALGVNLFRNEENSGFSRTVNVGLKSALYEGRDAILVNADVEFIEQGWLEALGRTDAYVAGGLLLYPNGLIQHGGIYFSTHNRELDHIYRMAPGDLPEANFRRRCPVTGALQLIRHEALVFAGLYDDGFRMGYEDVDYCIRVFDIGKDCVYEPKCRAIHHEGMFRHRDPSDTLSRWHGESKARLYEKHAGKSFASYMPTLLIPEEGKL